MIDGMSNNGENRTAASVWREPQDLGTLAAEGGLAGAATDAIGTRRNDAAPSAQTRMSTLRMVF
jgi:hypothetical protein